MLHRLLTETLAEGRSCSGGGPEWVEEGRGSSSLRVTLVSWGVKSPGHLRTAWPARGCLRDPVLSRALPSLLTSSLGCRCQHV